MRKALLFAPMLMLLLTACGGGEEKEPAAALQEQYAAVAAATLEADIPCHYDDEVRVYTLLCAYTPSSSTVTVLAPANLAGISATVAEGTLTLSYDDISLDAGSYSAAAISPVAALPKLMEAAAAGYLTEESQETVEERPCLRLAFTLPDQEDMVYTTWFDEESLLPLHSEISTQGTVVFEVAWSRFEITEQREPGTESTPTQPEGATQETPSQPEGTSQEPPAQPPATDPAQPQTPAGAG